jgi:hypothetical protein
MTFRTWLTIAAVIAGVVGAVLGLYAATIDVRDNIDAFMSDIHRQSEWAAWAAVAGCVAAVLSAIERLIKLRR